MTSPEVILKKPLPKFLLVASLLLVPILLAFHNALSCYFTCDDFWHLPLLHAAFNGEPELLLQNFYRPWAGITSIYLFYRPVTELTLALDYFFYHGNAFGYHLTSILYHWLNAVLVFYLAEALFIQFLYKEQKNQAPLFNQLLKAYLVALVFAVHPINTEPVTWILCRADLVGAAFFLLTILFVLKADASNKRFYKAFSYIFLSLALLSKESSATLPAVITMLFCFLNKQTSNQNVSFSKPLPILKSSLIKASYYWLILLIYLLVRSLSLGTFTGGYVGTIGHLLSETWVHRLFIPLSFWKMVHPFNAEMFQKNNTLELCLRALYVISGSMIILNKIYSPTIRERTRVFLYCLLSLLILFSINIQVWSISDGMTGSRIAYLLTVPVSIGLILLLIPQPVEKNDRVLALLGSIVVFMLSINYIFIANINTKAWLIASKQVRTIQKDLIKRAEHRKLAVFNLPQQIKGTIAFFSSDHLEGLLKPPLTEIDYTKNIVCLDEAPVASSKINMDLLKELTEEKNYEIRVFNQNRTTFEKPPALDTKESNPKDARQYFNLTIKELGLFAEPKIREGANFVFDNTLPGKKISSSRIFLPIPLTVPDHYILSLDIKATKRLKNDPVKVAALSWASTTPPVFKPVFFRLATKPGNHIYKIALAQYKEWLKDKPASILRLDLPAKDFKLDRAYLESKNGLVPSLKILSPHHIKTNGLIKVEGNDLLIKYDLNQIKGAESALLEVSKPNCQFEFYTGTLLDKDPAKQFLFKLRQNTNRGAFQITCKNDLPAHYYQIRVSGLDGKGRILGAFSQPLSLATSF